MLDAGKNTVPAVGNFYACVLTKINQLITHMNVPLISATNTTRISKSGIWPDRRIKEGFSAKVLGSEG